MKIDDTKIDLKYLRGEGEGYWKDLMRGFARVEQRVGDHGFVALVDLMPRMVWIPTVAGCDQEHVLKTAEVAIVRAARTSYGRGTKAVSEDRGLVRYLMRNSHNTPIEMVELCFHARMPIFVARQWIRHRTANVNEVSGRYTVMPADYYKPAIEGVRKQSTNNKQGSDGVVEDATANQFLAWLDRQCDAHKEYEELCEKGISREMARIGLPLALFTEWYWKIDLHNLFHFLRLRIDAHAQQEIRDYAVPMFEMVKLVAPFAAEAFVDYRVDAITLSGPEIRAIRAGDTVVGNNQRENSEFKDKKRHLGLP